MAAGRFANGKALRMETGNEPADCGAPISITQGRCVWLSKTAMVSLAMSKPRIRLGAVFRTGMDVLSFERFGLFAGVAKRPAAPSTLQAIERDGREP